MHQLLVGREGLPRDDIDVWAEDATCADEPRNEMIWRSDEIIKALFERSTGVHPLPVECEGSQSGATSASEEEAAIAELLPLRG
jgi:hypothetical protein